MCYETDVAVKVSCCKEDHFGSGTRQWATDCDHERFIPVTLRVERQFPSLEDAGHSSFYVDIDFVHLIMEEEWYSGRSPSAEVDVRPMRPELQWAHPTDYRDALEI